MWENLTSGRERGGIKLTNKIKRVSNRYIVSIIVFIVLISTFTLVVKAEPVFETKAESAILMDYGTGKILYEHNPKEKLPVASINKIMTLLLTYEAIEDGSLNLNDKVTISDHAASMGGSQVFLHEGEVLPVDALLKAVILASANDASVALAEKIAGTHEVFVKRMNDRAKELGMNDTSFANATGLPAENSYSTAYDVAIMSRELLKQPLFYKWSTVWVDTLKESKNNTALANTNRLVRFYEGADGVKTGSTSEAGYCLSATAKRGDMRLIAIVLGAPNSKIRFSEASKLLDYGFANYKTKLIQKKDQIIQKDIKISGGKTNLINGLASRDISLLLKIDDKDDFNRTILINDKLRAPIERGDKIGSLRIEIDGKTVDTIDIISDRNVSKAGLIDYIKKIFNSLIRK